MIKFFLGLIGSIAFLAVLITVSFRMITPGSSSFLAKSKPEVSINGKKFTVLVAKTEEEKQIGLSKTLNLEENEGMFFIFDNPGSYGFWMKDMKFAIDIIFIREGKIVTIYPDIQPPVSPEELPLAYNPEEPADMVLEINAGLSQRYGFQKGDAVKIQGL